MENPKEAVVTTSDKDRLETRKLKAEARNAEWCVPSLIQAAPTAIAVLATWYIASGTGLLDAKREHQQAEAKLLEFKTAKLQNQESELQIQLAATQKQLSITQLNLNHYIDEAEAIRAIRKLPVNSTIEYLDNEYGFRISISAPVDMWANARQRGGSDERVEVPVETISKALTHITSMRNVQELSISHARITKPELAKIKNLVDLRSLSLSHNFLDDELMLQFPVLPQLASLEFSYQDFEACPALIGYSRLRKVVIRNMNVRDKFVEDLRTSFPVLEEVVFHSTFISDKSVESWLKCPRLRVASFGHFDFTLAGAIALTSHPSIESISIFPSSGLSEEEFESRFKHVPRRHVIKNY